MKKPHIYQNLGGWFNFQDIYSQMVKQHTDHAHFVEIGTCLGKSASFMAVEIYNSSKEITFDTIDTFQGSPSELDGKHHFFKEINVLQRAQQALKGLPVNIIQGHSTYIAKKYKNHTLDFVFIDGSHTYKDVLADIKAWTPKLKKNAYIGGHDYDNPNVYRAVNKIFKKHCPVGINSWLIKIT